MAENAAGFKSEFIDGNFTEWVKEANTSSTGGLSLEHDITQVTINAAIKNLPALQVSRMHINLNTPFPFSHV